MDDDVVVIVVVVSKNQNRSKKKKNMPPLQSLRDKLRSFSLRKSSIDKREGSADLLGNRNSSPSSPKSAPVEDRDHRHRRRRRRWPIFGKAKTTTQKCVGHHDGQNDDDDDDFTSCSIEHHLPTDPSAYELREAVGKGMTAVVYSARVTLQAPLTPTSTPKAAEEDAVKMKKNNKSPFRRRRRRVAVKVVDLDALSDEAMESVLRETRLLAKLRHRGLAPLLSSFVADRPAPASLWLVMPLASTSARDVLDVAYRGRGLPERSAAAIVYSVAEALSYAHSQGVVHRDVKAQNVLLFSSQRGEGEGEGEGEESDDDDGDDDDDDRDGDDNDEDESDEEEEREGDETPSATRERKKEDKKQRGSSTSSLSAESFALSLLSKPLPRGTAKLSDLGSGNANDALLMSNRGGGGMGGSSVSVSMRQSCGNYNNGNYTPALSSSSFSSPPSSLLGGGGGGSNIGGSGSLVGGSRVSFARTSLSTLQEHEAPRSSRALREEQQRQQQQQQQQQEQQQQQQQQLQRTLSPSPSTKARNARAFAASKLTTYKTFAGSPAWIAPEVVEQGAAGYNGPACDIYSLGKRETFFFRFFHFFFFLLALSFFIWPFFSNTIPSLPSLPKKTTTSFRRPPRRARHGTAPDGLPPLRDADDGEAPRRRADARPRENLGALQ